MTVIKLSNSSRNPLEYALLLANSFHLGLDELQMSQSEEELWLTDTLLGRSRSALRLAAFSSESAGRRQFMLLLQTSQSFLIRK